MSNRAKLLDLGRMPYEECVQLQRDLLAKVAAGEEPNTLILVEHDPVLTLGANFHSENLLLPEAEYASRGIEVLRTDRGGDVTYHGPKQLVIYPIFDLRQFGKDLHKWIRDLEQTMLDVLAGYGIEGTRFPPNTGAWVNGRKIAAIGIKVSRWTSMHGIALNCNNDLEPFELIVPCGILDYGVTSLSQEVGREVTIDETKPRVVAAFQNVFGIEFDVENPA